MNKKLILTSIFAISVVGSAYAEPTNTVTGAPANGSYQADTTYTGAATVEELGVYEDNSTAIANANYEDILYNISAGNYLAAGSEGTETICPANSYCPGLTNVTYDATNNQGINACPTEFGLSAEGTSDSGQCYQLATGTCSTADTPAHAATCSYTSGSKRYASAPTTLDGSIDITCENGWHVGYIHPVPEAFREKPGNYTSSQSKPWSGVDENNPDNDLMPGEWKKVFDWGTLKGTTLCSTTGGTWATAGTPNESVSGGQCWCKLTSFLPSSGGEIKLQSQWGFHADFSYYLDPLKSCQENCGSNCKGIVDNGFTNIWMASTTLTPSCEANTINITWGDTDTADVTANNAGTVTYGEDIRTPVKAQHKAGKVFTGWTFTKPTQN